MADPNKMRITRNSENTEVLASDADGEVHDITSVFREISGSTTPSGFSNNMKVQVNGTVMDLTFTAVDKELNYTLPPEVAKQLCALV